MYASVYDPKGHRFGNIVSESLILCPRTGYCNSVIFRCDCGRRTKVSMIMIKRRQIPEGCRKCWKPEEPKKPTLRQQHPQEYNIWKRGGRRFAKRWKGPKGFQHFIWDMGVKPPGARLKKHDPKRWHSPWNSYWGFTKTKDRE